MPTKVAAVSTNTVRHSMDLLLGGVEADFVVSNAARRRRKRRL
jgi:hypothetical protein